MFCPDFDAKKYHILICKAVTDFMIAQKTRLWPNSEILLHSYSGHVNIHLSTKAVYQSCQNGTSEAR